MFQITMLMSASRVVRRCLSTVRQLLPALLACLTSLSTSAVFAREFPFDAVVDTPEAQVRSGPGERDYYPTSALKRGERVRVVRQELSGWYLIEPPVGSHSWIPASVVQRRENGLGVVTDNTFDRIGSSIHKSDFNIVHNVSKGTVVKILGEDTLTLERGPELMLRIEPPRLEYRYINSRDVVPADEYKGPGLLASSAADRQAGDPVNSNVIFDPASSPEPTAPFGAANGPPSSELPPSAASLAGPDITMPAFNDSTLGPASNAVGSPERPVAGSPSMTLQGASPGPELGSSPGPTTLPPLKPQPLQGGQTNGSTDRLAGIPKAADRLPASAADGLLTPAGPHDEDMLPDGIARGVTLRESQAINDAWRRLDEVDNRFRGMIRQPEPGWDLASLRKEYHAIQTNAAHPSVDAQVEKRLAAVDRYSDIQNDYLDLQQILKSTESRDEALRQSYASRWQSVSTESVPKTVVRAPLANSTDGSLADSAAVTSNPRDPFAASPATRPATPPAVVPQPAPVTPAPATRPPARFEGAGVIQRSSLKGRNGIYHVLVAPDGRVLTYLQAAPGMNLDGYVGRAAGLNGPRAFRSDLNADFMVVYRVTPVQLQAPRR